MALVSPQQSLSKAKEQLRAKDETIGGLEQRQQLSAAAVADMTAQLESQQEELSAALATVDGSRDELASALARADEADSRAMALEDTLARVEADHMDARRELMEDVLKEKVRWCATLLAQARL